MDQLIKNTEGNNNGRKTNRISAQVTYVSIILTSSFDEALSSLQEFYIHVQKKNSSTKCNYIIQPGNADDIHSQKQCAAGAQVHIFQKF